MSNLNRRTFLRLLGQGTAALGMGFSLSSGASCAKEKSGTTAVSGSEDTEGKYQIFQPGEYLDWEKAVVEDMIAAAKKAKEEFSPSVMVVDEANLLNRNRTWDPGNPLFNDKEYAQKAGHPNIPAIPCFTTPRGSGNVSLPSSELYDSHAFSNDGSDSQVWTHIFAGDSFTVEGEDLFVEDITVPGTDLRIFIKGDSGKMYNAKGEQVGWGYHTTRRAFRKIIDGSPRPSFNEKYAAWVKDFPPGHYTTDEEWEYIRELWKNEYIRGSQKLYWEDVEVGDEPTWTCSGPIGYMDLVGWNGGGQSGIRHKDGRPTDLKNMYRDMYGIYLPDTAMHYGGRNIPGSRMVFYNNTAAMHLTRMVTNYIGDAGLVTRICWKFKQLSKDMWNEKYEGGEYLDKVPYMKGKRLTMHGSEGDTVIAKGYVTDKYINDRGEHTIDLTTWAETLDNKIIQIVAASAKLPSKKG